MVMSRGHGVSIKRAEALVGIMIMMPTVGHDPPAGVGSRRPGV